MLDRGRPEPMTGPAGNLDAATTTPPRQSPGSRLLDAAKGHAAAAAAAAAVVVHGVDDPVEFGRICDLFRDIWAEDPNDPAVTPLLLHALSHAGNYVTVAEQQGDVVGACVGFLGANAHGWELHSHIAGVLGRAQGRSVGFALKTHQRAWALTLGLDRISWTFDPLVRRNAYFNLNKLAVRSSLYLENFYGPMTDGINRGDETDRLVAEWHLSDEAVIRACAGRPQQPDGADLRDGGAALGLATDSAGRPVQGAVDASTVLVAIPADIEGIRTGDSSLALAWRHEVRDVLGGLLGEGAVVTGFAPPSWYVVQRSTS